MVENKYYYSKTLGLYISLEPLKVNNKLLNIGKKIGVEISWNDDGMINFINYPDAKKILKELGSYMLSPNEYWQVINDAKEENRNDVIEALTSKKYVEWLDVVYIKNSDNRVFAYEKPDIIEEQNNIRFKGNPINLEVKEGRPGWFDYTENKDINGLPDKIYNSYMQINNKKYGWKYWSINQIDSYVSAIRGYVLSSGTPSLDLDIPIIAKQPVLTVRECKREIDFIEIDSEMNFFYEELEKDLRDINCKESGERNREKLEQFYLKMSKKLFEVDKKILKALSSYKLKDEKLINCIGVLKVFAIDKGDLKILNALNKLCCYLYGSSTEISMKDIERYIIGIRDEFKNAIHNGKEVIFVMGHENPDTDTVISCIFEGYRNKQINKEKVYIPIIQSTLIPDEVRELLGDVICNNLITFNDMLYKESKESGYARWILVDHNVSSIQKFVISIIDHHVLSDKNSNSNMPITWEMLGSTTALITLKLLGQGFIIKKDAAEVLYGATLMDTENRIKYKITDKDILIMSYLKNAAEINCDDILYKRLMGKLLSTDDVELLFKRDYKEEWDVFGFAVLKVKNLFDNRGKIIKDSVIERIKALAQEKNKKNNFSVTLVKITDYKNDNESINRERLYFVFNDNSPEDFKRVLINFGVELIKDIFKEDCEIFKGKDYIEFWNCDRQLSRKFIAPYFEKIIKEFNKYFYSPTANLYVKREFMKKSDNLLEVARKNNITLSFDENNRVNFIAYKEASNLLRVLGQRMMTLGEYWKALDDAEKLNDTQMINHLKSKDFVEILDTVIIDNKYIVNNCIFDDETDEIIGDKSEVNILEAIPALISVKDIDENTGFPYKLGNANEYSNKNLWRYWSPDSNFCIATRGYIFLLDQCALDTKIHLEDRLPNLGVRQCSDKYDSPIITYKDKVIS